MQICYLPVYRNDSILEGKKEMTAFQSPCEQFFVKLSVTSLMLTEYHTHLLHLSASVFFMMKMIKMKVNDAQCHIYIVQ